MRREAWVEVVGWEGRHRHLGSDGVEEGGGGQGFDLGPGQVGIEEEEVGDDDGREISQAQGAAGGQRRLGAAIVGAAAGGEFEAKVHGQVLIGVVML